MTASVGQALMKGSAAKAGVQLGRDSTRLKPCPPKVDVHALSQREEPILIFVAARLPRHIRNWRRKAAATDRAEIEGI